MTNDDFHDVLTKEEALQRVCVALAAVYSSGPNSRLDADIADVYALRIVEDRLNALAVEFGGNQTPPLYTNPYNPIVRVRGSRSFRWSGNFVWKWVSHYLPLMKRIEGLKTIAAVHEANQDYAQSCKKSWDYVSEFYGPDGEAYQVERVQELWDLLQLKQAELLEDGAIGGMVNYE